MPMPSKNGRPSPKPILYLAQNKALHKARQQLGLSIDDLRELAGSYNLGIKSLSKLSLDQRYQLIAELQRKGADVRNPIVTDWDRASDPLAPGGRGPGRGGKIVRFPSLSDKQRKLIDDLAARVQWRTPDGFARFCHKLIRATYPRNPREMTTIRLALASLIRQQAATAVGSL